MLTLLNSWYSIFSVVMSDRTDTRIEPALLPQQPQMAHYRRRYVPLDWATAPLNYYPTCPRGSYRSPAGVLPRSNRHQDITCHSAAVTHCVLGVLPYSSSHLPRGSCLSGCCRTPISSERNGNHVAYLVKKINRRNGGLTDRQFTARMK